MKEQAIQKINKVGKISYIIAVIAKIFVIFGLVASLAGTVICLVLPESLMEVTMQGNMIVEVDATGLGLEMDMTDLEEMQKSLEAGEEWRISTVQSGMVNAQLEVTAAGQSYEPVAVEMTENGVKMDMVSEDISFTIRDLAGLLGMASLALAMTVVTVSFISALCKAFRDCHSPFDANVIRKMQNVAIALIPWAIISTVTDSVIDSLQSNRLSFSVTVDMGVVLVVLIVLVLVYIFKYGAVLQQESDETL